MSKQQIEGAPGTKEFVKVVSELANRTFSDPGWQAAFKPETLGHSLEAFLDPQNKIKIDAPIKIAPQTDYRKYPFPSKEITLLGLAAYAGNAELVKELLALGADPSKTIPRTLSSVLNPSLDTNPLTLAIMSGDEETITALIEGCEARKIKKMLNPSSGTPPLRFAVYRSSTAIVTTLIRKGADANREIDDRPLLHEVLIHGTKKENILALLQNGAQLTTFPTGFRAITTERGLLDLSSPLAVAVATSTDGKTGAVEALLEHGIHTIPISKDWTDLSKDGRPTLLRELGKAAVYGNSSKPSEAQNPDQRNHVTKAAQMVLEKMGPISSEDKKQIKKGMKEGRKEAEKEGKHVNENLTLDTLLIAPKEQKEEKAQIPSAVVEKAKHVVPSPPVGTGFVRGEPDHATPHPLSRPASASVSQHR